MSTTTTKPTKAMLDLLAVLARSRAAQPVGARYTRTATALVTAGLATKKSTGYAATSEGRAALAAAGRVALPATTSSRDEVVANAAPAKAAPAKKPAKAPAKAKAQPAPAKPAKPSLRPVGGVQHPAHTLLDLLAAKGLSQTQAAHAMGVAPMTVNRLCNGHGLPTARITVAFAKVVRKPVAELWQGVCDYELACAVRDARKKKKTA